MNEDRQHVEQLRGVEVGNKRNGQQAPGQGRYGCNACNAVSEIGAERPHPGADRVVPMASTGQPLVYTVKEAAEELRIGYSTVREFIRTGELRSFKVGRRRLVAGDDLAAYVRTQVEKGAA